MNEPEVVEPVTANTQKYQHNDGESMDNDSSTDDESEDLDCHDDDPDWEYDAYASDDDEVEKRRRTNSINARSEVCNMFCILHKTDWYLADKPHTHSKFL